MHIKKPFTVLHNLKRLICVFRPFSSSLSTLLIFSLLTKRQHSLCIVPGGIAKCTVTENLVKSAWSNFKICVFWYGKKTWEICCSVLHRSSSLGRSSETGKLFSSRHHKSNKSVMFSQPQNREKKKGGRCQHHTTPTDNEFLSKTGAEPWPGIHSWLFNGRRVPTMQKSSKIFKF